MYKKHRKIKVPVVSDLKSLELADIKKILRYVQRYEQAVADFDNLQEETRKKNLAIQRAQDESKSKHQEYFNTHCRPIEVEIATTWSAMSNNQATLFERLLSKDIIQFRGLRLNRQICEPLIEKMLGLEDKLAKLRPKRLSVFDNRLLPNPKRPSGEINLKVSGATFKIPLYKIKSADVTDLIDQKNAEQAAKRQQIVDLKARAASTEKEIRAQAQKFKRDFKKQVHKIACCPYCGENFSDTTSPHLDHIYPVSKGGKSSTSNLVFVCQTCNLNKKALTLRSFIISFKLDETAIYRRLELLEKDF